MLIPAQVSNLGPGWVIVRPGLHVLGTGNNVAVLWDMLVSPAERGAGIGSALFRAAQN